MRDTDRTGANDFQALMADILSDMASGSVGPYTLRDAELAMVSRFNSADWYGKAGFRFQDLADERLGDPDGVLQAMRQLDAGEISWAEAEKALLAIAGRYAETKAERDIALLVPRRYLKATATLTSGQQAFLAKVASGCSGVVSGENGTGKTLAAWECVKEAIRHSRSAAMVPAIELFEEFRAAIRGSTGVIGFIRDSYVSKLDLLVIDETDKSYGTDSERAYLAYLVGQRYDEMKQTVVIGNFPTPQDAISCIGQSVYDRLTQSGEGFRLNLTGGSFRTGKREV